MICPKCKTENSDRNYYCKWCGVDLKDKVLNNTRSYNRRHEYLFELSIVEDDTNDRDVYLPYRAKMISKD